MLKNNYLLKQSIFFSILQRKVKKNSQEIFDKLGFLGISRKDVRPLLVSFIELEVSKTNFSCLPHTYEQFIMYEQIKLLGGRFTDKCSIQLCFVLVFSLFSLKMCLLLRCYEEEKLVFQAYTCFIFQPPRLKNI